jgi:hypothetical protein
MTRKDGAARWLCAAGRGGIVLLLLGFQGCCCVSYSNRLVLGPKPRKIESLKETDLCPQVNKELGGLARFLGFLTTPFKRMGILGWRDLGISIVAVGQVKQSSWSTDRFVTVDLHLSEIEGDGASITLRQRRYLRAEICERQLRLPKEQWPCPGDQVRIAGRLMWDGDGFLEVHPQYRSDIEILQKAPGKCR